MKKILFIALFIFPLISKAAPGLNFDGLALDRVGAHIGFVSPSDIDSSLGLGVELPFGEIYENVHIAASLDYWSSSFASIDYSDFIIGFNGRYMMKDLIKEIPLIFYAGGGLSLHFFSTDDIVTSVGTVDGSSTELGFDLFVGDIYQLEKNLDLFSEFRFRSNVEQIHIKLGAIYRFK